MSRTVIWHAPAVRARVIKLRRRGWSLDELSEKLQLPKTTVQGWVRSITLSARARKRIRRRILKGGRHGRSLAVAAWRRRSASSALEIFQTADALVGQIPLEPTLGRLVCALLYLCEGSKNRRAGRVCFGNSDPRVIRMFLSLLRRYFTVDEQRIRCQVMYRADQDFQKLVRYWSSVTDIPKTQFYQSQPDPRTRGKPTCKPHYAGVCVVQYGDARLFVMLQAIAEVFMKVVELAGLEPAKPPACHAGALPAELQPH